MSETECYECGAPLTTTCPACNFGDENKLRAQITRLTQDLKEARAIASAPESGNGEPCYYCGEICNALAGNPGLWPIPLTHEDEPGHVKYHHIQCVSRRLISAKEARDRAIDECIERAQTIYRFSDAQRKSMRSQDVIYWQHSLMSDTAVSNVIEAIRAVRGAQEMNNVPTAAEWESPIWLQNDNARLQSENDTLKSLVSELVKAAEPFVRIMQQAQHVHPSFDSNTDECELQVFYGDDPWPFSEIGFGDLRAISTAVEKAKKEGK